MNLVILTETGDRLVPGLPNEGSGAVVWITWIIILAIFVGGYLVVARTRSRATEQFLDMRRREEDLRANDPDLRKDDA